MSKMVSKLLVALILLWSHCLMVGMCQDMAALQEALKGGSPPACLQSIIPCQAYLKSDETPPDECCGPLKTAMKKDMSCLCKLFNNEDILKSVNLTREDALKLPSHCDKSVDTSVCDNIKESPDGAPSSSESQSSPPDSGCTESASASSSASAPPPTDSGANQMSHFGGFGFISILAIIISAM